MSDVGSSSGNSLRRNEEAREAERQTLAIWATTQMAHASVIPEAEARSIIALPKILAEDVIYAPSPTNSAFMLFDAILVDECAATIPSLTVTMSFRVGTIAPEDCKFLFTLFAFRPGGKRRVYQLEVVPEDKRSSTHEGVPIYGPHEHIGEHVAEVRLNGHGCMDHERWFMEFCRRANIQFGMKYFGPFSGDLFS